MDKDENWEDPFEQFIMRNVEFDEKGHSKLKSSHGLAKLLKRFSKEVVRQELDTQKKELVEEVAKKIARYFFDDELYSKTLKNKQYKMGYNKHSRLVRGMAVEIMKMSGEDLNEFINSLESENGHE